MLQSELSNIDNKIKLLIDNYTSNSNNSIDFESIAMEIHQFQYKYNDFYSTYCTKNSINHNLANFNEIPYFRIENFKGELIPSSVPINEKEGVFFETSGTTQGIKGKIYRDKQFFELINKTVFAIGSKIWFKNFDTKPDLIFLDFPNKRNLPNYPIEYSVLYNIKYFFGSEKSKFYNIKNHEELDELIEILKDNKTFVLISPSYYLSNLLDYIKTNKISVKINSNSLILDSGGLKNKSNHLNYTQYLNDLFQIFGINNFNYFNTYALTEIGSQFTNKHGQEFKEIPSWTKIKIVKNIDNKFVECENGEIGNILIYDLLNRGSLFGLLTSDLGILNENNLKIIGREISNNE